MSSTAVSGVTTDELSILLVEDDPVFARIMAHALNQREYQVSTADSREAAEELIAKESYVYAILDLNLGGQSSLALIPQLKQRNEKIRILVLTGYASITTAVEAMKLGADNYLAKPADLNEILAALLMGDSHSEGTENLQEPMSVRRLEWEHIQKVLMENDGNISATARQLKMHRRTLQRKLQKKPVAK
ncbi:MAG: response regulator [Pseudohongiellaceae bacterium]